MFLGLSDGLASGCLCVRETVELMDDVSQQDKSTGDLGQFASSLVDRLSRMLNRGSVNSTVWMELMSMQVAASLKDDSG